jgi:hypothetical protein
MRVQSIGQVSSFHELAPGMCFAFSLARKRYVGIKTIYDLPNPPLRAFAIIWWERAKTGDISWQHPMRDGQPVDLSDPSIWNEPVFAFPNAQLIPSSDASTIRTGIDITPAGCLIAAAPDTLVIVGATDIPDRVYFVEARSGRVIADLFNVSRSIPTVLIWNWSIVQIVDGERMTICSSPLGQ